MATSNQTTSSPIPARADIEHTPQLPTSTRELSSFINAHAKQKRVRVEDDLGDGYVRLHIQEAQTRQAKQDIRCVEDAVIELLRNSYDAGAHTIYIASERQENTRTLVVIDDGCGIPHALHKTVFEARVTSKLNSMHTDAWGVHGRGMALYSIAQNATRAFICASDKQLGCSLRVEFDTTTISEKKDQSTWPVLQRSAHVSQRVQGLQRLNPAHNTESIGANSADAGSAEAFANFTGPHNIYRTVAEFAWQNKANCQVYIGSPAEIVATLYARERDDTRASDMLFIDSYDTIPVCNRLSCAADAAELISLAHTLGLEISERTAHRIRSLHIKPLRPARVRLEHKPQPQPVVDIFSRDTSIHVSDADKQTLLHEVEACVERFSRKYYLREVGEPQLRITGGKISLHFTVEHDD